MDFFNVLYSNETGTWQRRKYLWESARILHGTKLWPFVTVILSPRSEHENNSDEIHSYARWVCHPNASSTSTFFQQNSFTWKQNGQYCWMHDVSTMRTLVKSFLKTRFAARKAEFSVFCRTKLRKQKKCSRFSVGITTTKNDDSNSNCTVVFGVEETVF